MSFVFIGGMTPFDIQSLGDRLAGLTPPQASELLAYLAQAYGIKALRPTIVKPAENEKPKPLPEAASFDVVLRSVGAKKIQVIVVVRQHTGLGLKEAKDLVESVPAKVKGGLSKEGAQKLMKELENQGAKAETCPSGE